MIKNKLTLELPPTPWEGVCKYEQCIYRAAGIFGKWKKISTGPWYVRQFIDEVHDFMPEELHYKVKFVKKRIKVIKNGR